MTENNGKPLTGDEIRAAVKHAHNMSGPSDATQPGEYVLAGALALLSKLRAEGDERAALSGLLDYVDRNTCTHENRHKAGTLWTICDDCGRKWASDRNPYTPHQDAPAVAAARAALARAPVAGEAQELAEALRDWHGKGDGITTTIPDELAQALYGYLHAAPQTSEAVADLLSDALYYLKGNLPDSAADHAHKAAVIARVESALAAHTKDSQ